jgi:K+-transporting ATPase A subunit
MIFQALVFFAIITIIAPLFGKYIAFVYRYEHAEHEQLKNKRARWESQNWQDYFLTLMYFNIICMISTFLISI